MPAVKKMYKVDRTEVEKMIALHTVTDQKDEAEALLYFCDTFSVPLDKNNIKAQIAEFEVVKTALTKSTKK